MSIIYNRLWKLLIDKGMTKTQLRKEIGIGTATLAKLSANEKVSMNVIERIHVALDCQPGDVMEFVSGEK
jgi:putative transcriptional regulator